MYFPKSSGVQDLEERLMLLSELKLTGHEARYVRASEYYWGNQYNGLRDWDTDADVGLYEKKPRVRIRLTKLAVNTVNTYLFGEQRRPRFSVERPDDAPELEEGEEDPLKAANSRITELEKESGLLEMYSEIGRLGLLHDAVAVGFHKQTMNGQPYYDAEILHGAGTVPVFGRDDKAKAAEEGVPFGELLELDERWREARKVNGEVRHYLRRRRWTSTETVEYQPIDIAELEVESLEDIRWEALRDEEATVQHDLGFVPGVWIPNGKVAHEYGGVPLVGPAEMELEDELNYTISQTGRGIAYNQDPRTVFADVSNLTEKPIKIGANNSIRIQSSPVGGHQARVEMLELAGDGQETAMKYSAQIQQFFMKLCSVVLHDPSTWTGALSGVALERILEPMLALVSKLRPFYGRRLSALLEKMYMADTGQDVDVAANWGQLITPTVEDRRAAVQTDGDALERGLIDERKATESIAPYYGIEDVDEFMARKAAEFGEQGTAGAGEGAALNSLEDTLAGG